MKLEDAYKTVFKDMKENGPDLFFGCYDAVNGSELFMFGVSTVMEFIAYKVGEETYSEFEDEFLANMEKSEKKV